VGVIVALALPFWIYLSSPKGGRESLLVARVALPVVALTHIAQDKGYFFDEGVDVTFADFTTGREGLDATCAGEYDLAIAFTTPVVHDIVMGKDLVILTGLHQSPRNTAVVALVGRSINEPKDLAGKTIGVTTGTSGEFFLDVLLTDNGLDSNSIVRQPLGIADAERHLKEGAVDAVVAWNPYLHRIRNEWPEHELRVFTSQVYVEMSMVVGLRKTVEDKSEAVARFLRALTRAQEYFAGYAADARLAASRQAKGAAHIEPDSPMWEDFTVSLGLNHVMLLTLDQEADWMRSRGLSGDTLPDFRHQIVDSYLRTILPDLVTLPLSDERRTRNSRSVHSGGRTP
jgi:NitT/TauT family transport system substrate-binding protein